MAALIFIVCAIFFVRKKIWNKGKKWIGIPTSLGVLGLLVGITCFYYAYLMFYGIPFIVIFILVLLIVEIKYRIKRGQRYKTLIVAKEKNWRITAGMISPIFIIIGAIILLNYHFPKLITVFWTFYDKLEALLTCLWSVMALIGIIMGLRGIKIARFICLIAGIIATAGMFIPIFSSYNLSGSLFGRYYFDPILILIGGIIGVASKDEFLTYYINKYEFRLDKINLI